MKKLSKLFLMGMAAVSLFTVTSCESDDSGNNNSNLDPRLILDGTGDFIASDVTRLNGDSLKFNISAFENSETGKNLRTLTVTRVFDNTPTVVLDSAFNESSFGPFTIATVAQNEAGEEKWLFEVVDKDDRSKTVELTVTTVAPFTELPGVLENIDGPSGCTGAFDLSKNEGLTAADDDAGKDMENLSQGTSFTGSFKSLTDTRFKAVTGTDIEGAGLIFPNTFDDKDDFYANAGPDDVEAYYNNDDEPIVDQVDDPQVGNVYAFRLVRGGTVTFGMVKISEVNPNEKCSPSQTSANTGVMRFNYKK